MTNCKYAKLKDGKFFFPQSSKKVIMTSNFDKNDLGEDPFALGMEIHWDKRKRVLELSQRAYLEKSSKDIQYACEKVYACPIVKGNRFGISNIPGTVI